MSLADKFNKDYTARKDNDYVLSLAYNMNGGSVYMAFDFMTRTMVARTGYGDGGLALTPFAQLDREVLTDMRDTLIELGGNPPPLPPETPATQAASKKFNL